MKLSIQDFFIKIVQIRSFKQIWSHLLKKSLMEKFIFCAKTFSHQLKVLFLYTKYLKLISIWIQFH